MTQRPQTATRRTPSRRASYPSRTACRRLLERHEVPEHIRRHCGLVAQVARRIAEGLRKHRGEPVDVGLVEAAALLHDIAKVPCIASRLDHAAEGGRVLRELGFDRIADLVEQHMILGPFDPEGSVSEAEIVNYADKRVLYEEIVSLEERFRDLIARYSRGRSDIEKRIRGNWSTMAAVEFKIFGRLPFGPSDISLRRARRSTQPGQPLRGCEIP